MLRVGITGGIGSGKTIVAKVFAGIGIPVYNADSAAKRLMEEDPALRESIMAHFGPTAYLEGKLNRPFISSIVFHDKKKLDLLNSLVHPATIRDGEKWMHNQGTPYALKEAALIFETGSQSNLDLVIGVYAPQHLRIHRVMQRDKVSREEVIKRMENQISEEIKMKLCDYVIVNDDLKLVVPQVLQVHDDLLKAAQNQYSPLPDSASE
jgi:dephospho-CoA kinase